MSSNQTQVASKGFREHTSVDASGTETSYPFLVHSQESLSQQTPPDVDNQRLARQKRKRTSPEDHAILEAEYGRNPKPDKAARFEIVKKVALGEKEVQIWFQNRRQVTRRKSRPLLPHEILANLQPGSQDSEHTHFSSNSFEESSQQRLSSSQSSATNSRSQCYHMGTDFPVKASQVAGTHEHAPSSDDSSCEPTTNTGPLVVDLSHGNVVRTRKVSFNDTKAGFEGVVRSGGLFRSLSQTLPKKRQPEALASRRSTSFIVHDYGRHAGIPSVPAFNSGNAEQGSVSVDTSKPSHPLKRTSSLVRLSMSLDGKAQVTTSTGTTPSPPRSQPAPFSDPVRRPHTGLQRSFSAIEHSKNDSRNSISRPSFRRPATGRSRDARTWEFYCDKDARDALTEQAEREESGSATAAIALIKSNSNTSKAMTANPNKRNAHSQKLEATKRLKANFQVTHKPRLGRSQSSIANMQTVSNSSHARDLKAGKVHRKADSQSAVFEIYDDDDDSDKENWAPGTQQRSPRRQRPADSSRTRRILEESLHHSSSLGALMGQERMMSRNSLPKSASTSSTEEKENGRPEIDDEIATFMGESSGPREADELDCVQNLLSLSQAAWQ